MRMPLSALSFCLVSLLSLAAIASQPEAVKLEHPGDTALSEDAPGKYVYKSFPTLFRLYVYDKDQAGKSNCSGGCASAWPPLRVSASEKSPVGDWTIMQRDDGSRQWAYKKHPVYTRFHDIDPDPDSEKEGFHLLTP
jgi:predicted lipoprotein with Yx(FWY)xxD motif